MKKSSFILILLTGILGFMINSCSKSNPNPAATPPSPVGTWTHPNSSYIVKVDIKSDHNYSFSVDTTKSEYGSFTNTNSVLTFTSTSASCVNQPGAYTYSINGDTMTLAVSSDNCSGRFPVITGKWARQ